MRRVGWFGVPLRVVLAWALLVVADLAAASSSDYSEAIGLAVNRWSQVQTTSGLLPYGYDFLKDAPSEPHGLSAANLTRQAGAAAALADYYGQSGDRRAREAIVRYLKAFEGHSLPIGKSRAQALVEMTRVLSVPAGRYRLAAALSTFELLYRESGPGKVLSPTPAYSEAYTGAVALALLTELRYSRAARDDRFAELRRSWLEGLLTLRIPGDGFRQFPTSIEPNSYFDGQAWLALAEYHRAFPDDKRIGAFLEDVDDALLDKFENVYKITMFHWGAMAAAVRFSDTKDRRFLGFLKNQAAKFLQRMKGHEDSHNNCASVEGVADIMGVLRTAGEQDSDLFKRAAEWTAAEMRKAKLLQIQPGQQELVFSNARILVPRMQQFAGEFRSSIYGADTQLDYTGHCVSAMVKLTRHNLALE